MALPKFVRDINRINVEQTEQWFVFNKNIPFLQFKQEWMVRIIAPFYGAMVRFLVEYKGKEVSVYLDSNDALGSVGKPYWEVYSITSSDENTYRYLMNDHESMIKKVRELLEDN